MKCKTCNQEFYDNADGFVQLTFHRLVRCEKWEETNVDLREFNRIPVDRY